MTLTEENVSNTAFDLEQLVFDYDHDKQVIVDEATIQTLRDAVEFLRALRFYAD